MCLPMLPGERKGVRFMLAKSAALLLTIVLMFGGCLPMPAKAETVQETFTQGLWRGQDPRVSFDKQTGTYYYVEDTAAGIVLFRSKSLIERGGEDNRRVLPRGFPLAAPVYVQSMNGVRYDKWYAFGAAAWECDGDPFTGKWTCIGSFSLAGWTLDHYAFRVESGEHEGEWYFIWAAGEDKSNTTGFSAENLHIARMLSPTELSSTAGDRHDLLLRCAKSAGWTGWDVEAPTVAQKNGTITVIYSATDCKTNAYALGLLVHTGGDLLDRNNWVDLSKDAPAFSQTISSDVYGTPYGTGVASVTVSADGTEDWFYYNAKLYHDIPADITGNREAWTRIINLKQIHWVEMEIDGKTLTVPDLGTPDMMGTQLARPSGDPGITETDYYLFEAEHAVPFGWIYTKELQSSFGDDNEPYNLMFESRRNASLNGCMKHFDWFAADPAGDGTSGLHFRNVPASKSLLIRAGTNDPNGGFHILVNGEKKATVHFRQNVNEDGSLASSYIFHDYRIMLDIPAGATVTLQYVRGEFDDAAVDFLVFENDTQYPSEDVTDVN